MQQILGIAIVSMILALTLYTVGVWSERFNGRLKFWHLVFFCAGLVFDTAGTALMSAMAGSISFDFHGITGALAIALMLGHAVWAGIVLLLKKENAIVNFHKFSLIVWTLWLIPFVSGLGGAMLG